MLSDKLHNFGLSKFIELYSTDLCSQTVNPWHIAVNLKATPSQVNYFMLPRDGVTRNQRLYQFIASQVKSRNFLKALQVTNNDHILQFIQKKLTHESADLLLLRESNLDLTKRLSKTQHKIAELERNPVPIGFVYFQLPGEPSAKELWPTLTGWKDVTSEYAGLFFRAEGGQSAPFGQTQPEQSRQIAQVTSVTGHSSTSIFMPKEGWSDPLRLGPHKVSFPGSHSAQDTDGVKFRVKGAEVRPVNTAVRMWKRLN